MTDRGSFTDFATTYYGGATTEGRIEFYEYSRGTYALSRLLATTESFRRTGRVPGRITGASNIEIFTQVPEIGSWRLINKILTESSTKVGASFDALISWTMGRALDNIDLFNSNVDAIIDGDDEIDFGLADANGSNRPPRKKYSAEEKISTSDVPLTPAAIEKEKEANRELREKRLSLESEIAIARRYARASHDREDVHERVASLEVRLQEIDDLISKNKLRVYDEEKTLLRGLGAYIGQAVKSDDQLDRRSIRADYAVDDIEARMNRRLLGEAINFGLFEIPAGEEDKLASRARALTREIVLPLRRSPTSMALQAGPERRRIVTIDEIRGRFISDSSLSAEAYTIDVFVIEYNRVFHSGRCRIEGVETHEGGVPFNLRRQLVDRLSTKAIDSLKERRCSMLARVYFDDSGAVRSLLVEDIDFG